MSEEIIAASKERITELLEPINGGAGEDVSYDDKFEEIKTEIEKIASLTGEKPNWDNVATSSEEILQEKSKDFRVACYLATCRAHQGSVEKVLDGVTLLSEITTRFWDDMFPPLQRIRARAGMVGWWSDQAAPMLGDIKLKSADRNTVEALDKASVALDELFRAKFADHYTGMGKLREAVRQMMRDCPKEVPKEAPKPEAAPAASAPSAREPARPAPVQAAPAADFGEITTMADAEKALEPAGRQLIKIARAMRDAKPENSLAYRLSRFGMWIDYMGAPSADAGVTMLPGPPGNLKDQLDALLAAGDFLALMTQADDVAIDFPLWLDPHRYVSTAMSAMGALFMKAHDELLLGVALFLKRIPALIKLQFNDGMPFADGATQMWIESQVQPALGSGGGGGGGGGGQGSALEEPIKEARDLAVKGELPKALSVLAAASASAPTPADQFRGRLAMAQLCLGASKYALARSQLEGLAAIIDRHQLATWDPVLSGEVYAGLYASIKGMNDPRKPPPDAPPDAPGIPPADAAAELAAFQALCRLDPAGALKLGGG